MDELLREIVTASDQRAEFILQAWINGAALSVSFGMRQVLTPDAMAALGPMPAAIAQLTNEERELLIAQSAEATRRLLLRAVRP
jgi:hypothetical protein